MSSSLSAVPIERRRRAALMALAMSVVLLAVGLLPWVMAAPISIRVLAAMCGMGGLMFLLAGAGLVRTIRADLRPAPVLGCQGCQCGCGRD